MNPVLALIIANIIWGAASPVFKLALENIPPFTLAFIRFFFAGLIFTYFALTNWQKLTLRQLAIICLGGFFDVVINISFFFMGLAKTSSINAPVIASSQPIFLFLFSVLVLREKPSKRVLAGIFIAFAGVMTIVLSPFLRDGSLSEAARTNALEGNLYLLVATLGSVTSVLILKKILKEVNHYLVSFICFIFGSLFFIPFMHMELQKWSFALIDGRGWLGILFGVLLSSAAAYTLHNYGMSKINAQEVGIFTYIDPVAGVLLAIPLVHEHPDVSFFAGAFFVFAGIMIAEGRLHWHPLHKIKKKASFPAATRAAFSEEKAWD